jgi:deoxycytidylate deaminase
MQGLPSFFTLAKNVSTYSDYRIKMGAVLVSGGNVFAVGFNKNKTHPFLENGKVLESTVHAEISAIISSGKSYLNNSKMFIYRERRDGTPGMARPCIQCMKSLKKFGVKKIWYTTPTYPFFSVERI